MQFGYGGSEYGCSQSICEPALLYGDEWSFHFQYFPNTYYFFPGQRIYFDKINLRVLFERSEFFGRVGNIFPNSNHKHMHTTHTNTHQRHICDQKRFYKLISNSIWNIILIILPRLSFQFLVYVPGGVGSSSIRLSSHFFPFPPIQNNNNNINNRKIHRHSDFPTIDARLSCDSTMCVYVRCAMDGSVIGKHANILCDSNIYQNHIVPHIINFWHNKYNVMKEWRAKWYMAHAL